MKSETTHDHFHRHFNKKRLLYAIAITFVMLIIEIAGGIYSHSLALLSDAAHMFSHLFSLGISYTAIVISLRPATSEKTYGYYRAEILAAFINGLLLIIIVFAILYGAYERFMQPVDIRSNEMFIVATAGMFVNVVTAILLRKGSLKDMNIRGAFLHALGDLISSVGVVIVAIIIYFTHITIFDTIISVGISMVIAYWALKLIMESMHVLLEGKPKELDIEEVKSAIKKIIGREILIHHLHSWQIGTRIYALTAHVSIEHIDPHEATKLLKEIKQALSDGFAIEHTTIQFECMSCDDIKFEKGIMDNEPCATKIKTQN